MTFKLKITKKEDIFIISVGLILVVIVFAIVFITATNLQNTQNISPTPTPSPTPYPTLVPVPTPKGAHQSIGAPLQYDITASNKLLDYFDNRRTLTNTDSVAKATILSLLPTGVESGLIYQSSDYNIEYVHSADIFLVQITTPNIQSVKTEASLWFQAHGISQQGICTLPVEFYMDSDVAQQLRSQNIIFSPLPPGC